MPSWQSKYPEAASFLERFKPYQGAYRQKQGPVDGQLAFTGEASENWIHIESRLTPALIQKAIQEKARVSFFNRHSSSLLGIDIDDHNSDTFSEPSTRMLKTYSQVVDALGFPSVVFRSPRGMHCYWLFSNQLPFEVLRVRAMQRLKRMPSGLEILPTPNKSLRIPSETRQLDPKNLFTPVKFDIDSVKPMHFTDAIGLESLPSEVRLDFKAKRELSKGLKQETRLSNLEKKLRDEISNGHSNEVYKKLATAYYRAGYTVEQAEIRLVDFLHTTDYTGSLLFNRRERRTRLKSSYRHFQKNYPIGGFDYSKNTSVQITIEDEILVSSLLNQNPFSRQRAKAVEQFIRNLFYWINYHDAIFFNETDLALWDYVYPYYRQRRKAGFYPLPRNTLQGWNHRYKEIIEWLSGIGVVQDSGLPFVAGAGISKYYKVNRLVERATDKGAELVEGLRAVPLKQSAIAAVLGVSRDAVSKWLKGVRIPRKEYYRDIEHLIQSVDRSAPHIKQQPGLESLDTGL